MLIFTGDEEYLKLNEDVQHIAHVMFYLQLIQTIFCFFCTFVEYYKFDGPNSWMRYNKIMPYFHFCFTRAIFYVFPFIYIGLYIYGIITTDLKSSYLGPYFALQVFTSFPLIYWYDNTIDDILQQYIQDLVENKWPYDIVDKEAYEEYMKPENVEARQEQIDAGEETRDPEEAMYETVFGISSYESKERNAG